jgi:hypothetical protein
LIINWIHLTCPNVHSIIISFAIKGIVPLWTNQLAIVIVWGHQTVGHLSYKFNDDLWPRNVFLTCIPVRMKLVFFFSETWFRYFFIQYLFNCSTLYETTSLKLLCALWWKYSATPKTWTLIIVSVPMFRNKLFVYLLQIRWNFSKYIL